MWERLTPQVSCMRSMGSGGAFHRAYRRATQQPFWRPTNLAFPYFGGVIGRLRYDNLGSAVKKTNSGGEGRKCAFAWGKPIPAAFVESFNGKFLHACLNAHWLVDLPHARRRIGACNIHYNTGRPA